MLDDAEREARVKAILVAVRGVAEDTKVDPESAGRAIAELGANLIDAARGVEQRERGARGKHLGTSARGTMTRKIRKALGYNYP